MKARIGSFSLRLEERAGHHRLVVETDHAAPLRLIHTEISHAGIAALRAIADAAEIRIGKPMEPVRKTARPPAVPVETQERLI